MTNDQVKQLRLDLESTAEKFDGCVTVDKFSTVGYSSTQKKTENHPVLEKALRKVRFAKYWLSMYLRYEGDKDPTGKPATTTTTAQQEGSGKSKPKPKTAKEELEEKQNPLITFRSDLGILIEGMGDFVGTGVQAIRSWNNAWNYLHEARFYLTELITEQTQAKDENTAEEK